MAAESRQPSADLTELQWSLLTVPQRAPGESTAAMFTRALDIAGVAAEGGFASCYYPEHHGRADDYPSAPLVLAALVAGRYPQLRVATGVTLLPLHNPVTLAEQAATLDAASGGRLHRLGVAMGDLAPEYAALGVPHEQMVARFERALDVVARLWRGDEVTVQFSPDIELRGARLAPRPVSLEAPLAVGAMSPRGVERAARLGLPWIADPMHSLESLERLAERYWSIAGSGGSVILMRQAWSEVDGVPAEQVWWPHVRSSIWGFSIAAGRLREEPQLATLRSEDELRFAHFASRFLVGSPDQVLEQGAAAARRLGASEVVLRFGFQTGPSHEAVCASVRSVGEVLARPGLPDPSRTSPIGTGQGAT